MGAGLDAAARLKRDLASLLDASRGAARDYGAAGATFRRLLLADLSLARAALVRGLVFLMLCVIMVGTAWVTAMVLLVVALNAAGLSLLWSLTIPLLASLAIAGIAWGVARKALALADLDATRRELAAWFPPEPEAGASSPSLSPTPEPAAPAADVAAADATPKDG